MENIEWGSDLIWVAVHSTDICMCVRWCGDDEAYGIVPASLNLEFSGTERSSLPLIRFSYLIALVRISHTS